MNPTKTLFALSIIMALFLAASCEKDSLADFDMNSCDSTSNAGNNVAPWTPGKDTAQAKPEKSDTQSTAGFDVSVNDWENTKKEDIKL